MSLINDLVGISNVVSPEIAGPQAEALRQKNATVDYSKKKLGNDQNFSQYVLNDTTGRAADLYDKQSGAIDTNTAARSKYNDDYTKYLQDSSLNDANTADSDQKQNEQIDQGNKADAEIRAGQARDFATGQSSILDSQLKALDSQFSGYDDNYYKGIAQDYADAHLPDVERQYDQRGQGENYDRWRQGIQDSGEASRQLGQLSMDRGSAENAVTNAGNNQAAQMRNTIDQNKQSMFSHIIDSINMAGRPDVAGANLGTILDKPFFTNQAKAAANPGSYAPTGDTRAAPGANPTPHGMPSPLSPPGAPPDGTAGGGGTTAFDGNSDGGQLSGYDENRNPVYAHYGQPAPTDPASPSTLTLPQPKYAPAAPTASAPVDPTQRMASSMEQPINFAPQGGGNGSFSPQYKAQAQAQKMSLDPAQRMASSMEQPDADGIGAAPQAPKFAPQPKARTQQAQVTVLG